MPASEHDSCSLSHAREDALENGSRLRRQKATNSGKREQTAATAQARGVGVRRLLSDVGFGRFHNARGFPRCRNHPHRVPVVRQLFSAIQADDIRARHLGYRGAFPTPDASGKRVVLVPAAEQRVEDISKHLPHPLWARFDPRTHAVKTSTGLARGALPWETQLGPFRPTATDKNASLFRFRKARKGFDSKGPPLTKLKTQFATNLADCKSMFCTGEEAQLPESGFLTHMCPHVVWLQDFARIDAAIRKTCRFETPK